MRITFIATTILLLVAGTMATAQTGTGTSTSTSTKNPSSEKQGPWPAPVGHRQPRVDQVPSEKDLSNPNDAANREDATLDRKIKSICRGC